MEIGLFTFTPPSMGGDKGEGGSISPSPRSSPTRGEEVFCWLLVWPKPKPGIFSVLSVLRRTYVCSGP